MKNPTKNQQAYQALLKKYSRGAIAEMAGVSKQAVTKWQSVPLIRVHTISQNSGIPPEELLPEPYSTE